MVLENRATRSVMETAFERFRSSTHRRQIPKISKVLIMLLDRRAPIFGGFQMTVNLSIRELIVAVERRKGIIMR